MEDGRQRDDAPRDEAAAAEKGHAERLPWIALLVALSPAVAEIVRHVRAEPWARYVAIPAALLAWASLRPSARGRTLRRALPGLGAMICGLGLEFWGLFAGPPQLARFSLPLGILGMAFWTGRPPLRTALLALWMVPVPFLVMRTLEPAVLEPILIAATQPLHALGVATRTEIRLAPQDGGLPLAALLSCLGWFAAERRGSSLGVCARWAAAAGLAALPLQVAAVSAAAVLAGRGAAPAARIWLDQGAPASAAAVALALTAWRLQHPANGNARA